MTEVVYEDTPHRISIVTEKDVKVTREDLLPNNSAFILHNLLTESECQLVMEHALELGLRDSGYQHKIRVCDRVSAMGDDFADVLYRRAIPFLSDVHCNNPSESVEEGLDSDLPNGKYVHYKLNPCFRIVRYHPGGYFRPHFDGGFAEDASHLSIKTFMIYLNDEFEGGTTRFFTEKQRHYSSVIDASSIAFEIRPRRGSCLVFNHALTHDGSDVVSGEKWILRSEVMYRRVEPAEEPSCLDRGS